MPKNLMDIHVWMEGQSTLLHPQHGMVVTILSQFTFHVALVWYCTVTAASDMTSVGYIMIVCVT